MEEQKPITDSANDSESNYGIWDNAQPYSEKIKFETNVPVTVTFPADFERPKEMPPMKEGDNPYCIFEVQVDGEDRAIMTSSITLLKNLKAHTPLARKTLTIVKKNVGGKNFFYIEEATDEKDLL